MFSGRTRVRMKSFQQSPEGSACHGIDARSPPDIPDKVGMRRLSGMSCWSRLNDAVAGAYGLAGARGAAATIALSAPFTTSSAVERVRKIS